MSEGPRKVSDALEKESPTEEAGRKDRGPSIDELINEDSSD
jgi:hypothetical protein